MYVQKYLLLKLMVFSLNLNHNFFYCIIIFFSNIIIITKYNYLIMRMSQKVMPFSLVQE